MTEHNRAMDAAFFAYEAHLSPNWPCNYRGLETAIAAYMAALGQDDDYKRADLAKAKACGRVNCYS